MTEQEYTPTERRNLAERLHQFAESQRMDFNAPDSAAMLDRAADALLADERAKRPDREQERARVITLCGSSRFKDEFHAENQRLTMEGNVVISLGLFGHADMPDYDWTTDATDLKRTLDCLHFQKIDMADEVHVVAPGGYVGESTAREIAYAQSLGKVVSYSDPAVLALEPEAREERRPSRVLNEYDDSTTRGLRRGEEVLRQLEHHWAADSATQAIEELLRLRRIVEAHEVSHD